MSAYYYSTDVAEMIAIFFNGCKKYNVFAVVVEIHLIKPIEQSLGAYSDNTSLLENSISVRISN